MKTFITLGLIDDKHVVLKDPSPDYAKHRNFICGLVADGGKIKSGKNVQQVSEAAVVLVNRMSITKLVKYK